MHYEPIPELTRIEVETAIDRDDPHELSMAVLSAALHSNEPEWAQQICLCLSRHANNTVRGNAILGFGHIARIHRTLDREKVEPALMRALSDPDEYVRGHARDAVDDVAHYLNWKIRHSSLLAV
jgi:hypothetical protein